MNVKNTPAYELVLTQELPDIHAVGTLLKHRKTGARVMLLETDDNNKVFNIAFRTTPSDSTGVAHIMEHSVLCGSRAFPAKDPFVELVKGSMNTFLNAMTYSDKTMFPVASCNDADFANLMHVYLDAVFYPNIYKKEEIFRQEGWSCQLENPEDDPVINGVVYNEMKGAFSNSEDVLEREIQCSLFPDNTYGFESGGDPDCIPNLTYEAFLDFHRTYYHPSNAYIYLYGDMDMEERLNWMDEAYLSHFDDHPVNSEITLQKPFEKMARVERFYPIGAEESEEESTWLSYNAVVGTSSDLMETAAFSVLEYALLETPGAPLKQALLDAGIGSDISSSYDSGIRQPVFSVIAKDASCEDRDRFLKVIFDELARIADQGVDEKAILAALNLMEFRFREADYGTFPRGLIYGIDVFDTWLYDDLAPFDALTAPVQYAFLREQAGTGYYEDLIRKKLLNNPHSSLVVLRGKSGLSSENEERLKAKMAAMKAEMTPDQIDEMIAKTRQLRAFQETPSTKEELDTIPMLSRKDLRKNALPFATEVREVGGVPVLYQSYNTYGIAYYSVLFDAVALTPEDLPWLGVLKNVLGMVDTEHYSYGELFNEINIYTGGITPGVSLYPDTFNSSEGKLALGVKVRTMPDQIGFSMQMIREILLTSDLDMDKRLLELIRKLAARLETRLIASGSGTAAGRAMSYFSWQSRINETISGVDFYHMLKDIADHFEDRKEELKANMRSVLGRILKAGNMMLIFTGEEAWLDLLSPGIEALVRELEGEPDAHLLNPFSIAPFGRKNEGLTSAAKIQYVARCGNFVKEGYSFTGSMRVLKTIMNYEYLWNRLRVVGGAYGCSGSFSRNGDTVFVSYRDPHLTRTMETYEEIPEYLRNFEADERDMTKYVIGAVSDMDIPLSASIMGERSAMAYICGLTLEQIQKERDEVLKTDVPDIRALAPVIEAVLKQNYLCVVGNEDKLREAGDLFSSLSAL